MNIRPPKYTNSIPCICSKLEILRSGNNQLMTLPESIGNLSSLKELYLYNNKLMFITLPKVMFIYSIKTL